MTGILLTKDPGRIIGPIAALLGYIMEGIFYVLDKIGIPNIGLAIILFTIVMYLLLLPLTIKQQKFSKLSAKMNPELQAIQAKYKGKNDNESMMAMNMEQKAVYAKYGVSPSGSCIQLIIQLPILWALYRVINNMPAYVTRIGDTFRVLANKIISVDNGYFLQNSGIETIGKTVLTYGKNITGDNIQNGIVDVLNKLSSSDMKIISNYYELSNLQFNKEFILDQLNANGEVITRGLINKYNNFLGLNIANSPSFTMKAALADKSFLMVIAALSIPVLSAVTQWINVKLMPQQNTQQDNKNASDQQNAMMQSMKTMNMMMPIMSAVFCYTLPAGLGLYWIAGAVVRSVQQVVINKHIDKMDLDEVIKNNEEKAKKKMAKAGVRAEQMAAYANMNTKNVSTSKKQSNTPAMTQEEKDEAVRKSTEYYNKNAKPGSMMSKANMVKQYNEKNNK